MSFFYKIYGLTVCATRPIPGLVQIPAPRQCDFEICFGTAAPRRASADLIGKAKIEYVSGQCAADGAPSWRLCQLNDRRFQLHYHDGTEFIIDFSARAIWATWPDSLTLADTVTYLLGPVLGFVLRRSGMICLHASAVAINGHAVLFAGAPGAGKSTTAAAFARLGFAVLTDDIAALAINTHQVLVHPGYPRVNLWADSAAAIAGATGNLPLLTPTWDKHFLDLTANRHRFQTEPLPLAAIYLLGERSSNGATPVVEVLSANSKLISLIANSYANKLLEQHQRAEEFIQLGALVRQVRLRRIVPPADFARLPSLCRTILDDLRQADRSPGDWHMALPL